MNAETLDQPAQGEDEDYVDYLGRKSDWYSERPPAAPEGFELLPCEADPRHFPTYQPIDEDFYPAGCPMCSYRLLQEQHSPCEHKGHGAWRRWKVSSRVVSWLSALGLVRGYGHTFSTYCRGCITGVHWVGPGRPPRYILGASREWWTCLRSGHLRHEDRYGFCSTCFPDLDA